MTQRPIDVWNVETFDKDLTAVLEKNADLIQGYMKTDREIFLAYDHYSGPDRPLARPDNAYATRFYDVQEMVGEQMRARVIRAFHYTRMTDAEIAILRRQGIHLSTPETLRARLDALVATGSRGDHVRNGGSAPDPRELPPKGLRTRDIYIPDLHIDTIKVKSRDFH